MDARHVLGRRHALAPQTVHHGGAVELRIELYYVDEPRTFVVAVAGARRLDTIHVLQQFAVTTSGCLAELEDLVKLLQLREPDRSLNVRPAIVHAKPNVMEPPTSSIVGPALIAEAAQQLPLLLGVGRDDATYASRHLLVRIEGEDRGRPMRSERTAAILRAKGLACILDQHKAVAVGDRPQLVELARQPEHVDRHDRAGSFRDRRLDRGRIEIERDRVDVGEEGCGTLEDEAVRRG